MLFPNGLHFDIKDKIFGTDDLSPLFSVINNKKEPDSGSDCEMVTPAGVEPAIFWMRTRRPRPLDDGAEVSRKRKFIFFFYERGFESAQRLRSHSTYSIINF